VSNKLLILSEYFYPDERTDAFLISEITKKFDEVLEGNIKIICTSSLEGQEEIFSLRNKILRLKKNKLNETNLFIRIIKFLILTTKISFYAYKNIQKGDNVFLTTNPAFLMIVIALFKYFKTFKYTLLVYDVFPENLAAAKIISKKGLFYKIINSIYNWAYSKADKLIVIGMDMQEILTLKTGQKVSIEIIENWCDYKSVKPSSKLENKILKNLQIENKIVFLFAGNLGRVQGIPTLLKAFQLVKNREIALLFIGKGAYKEEIIKHISENKSSNVYYGGSFPISQQNEFLNACDISIISLSSEMYGLGVPSKSYYNMSAKKPILYIGDEKSEIAQVVHNFKIGWNIEANEPELLANLLDTISLESAKFESMGKRAREVVAEYYSKEIILSKYAKLYEIDK